MFTVAANMARVFVSLPLPTHMVARSGPISGVNSDAIIARVNRIILHLVGW
jgi:hypothetical protein